MNRLIPESLLRYSHQDGMILPAYLDHRDHPWLGALLGIYRDYAGKPRRRLNARLLEDLPVSSPIGKRKLAIHVLNRLTTARSISGSVSSKLRLALFVAAAASNKSSGIPWHVAIKCSVARQFEITEEELDATLFADLPSERAVPEVETGLSLAELALRANLALIQGFLFRAAMVEMELSGNSRAIVRQAKLRGLLTTVRNNPVGPAAMLEVSGPFTLFKKTLLYGRSLSELVPLLAWCNRFELRATCYLRRGTEQGMLIVRSGDPFLPANPPRQFDSALEDHFAKDFGKLVSDWDLVREPEPLEADGTLIFPDFLIKHRHDPMRSYILEIIGFWTPDYLAQKLARLKAARVNNLILCVDETLNCSEQSVPGAEVLYFKRRIDARQVLKLLELRHSSNIDTTKCST